MSPPFAFSKVFYHNKKRVTEKTINKYIFYEMGLSIFVEGINSYSKEHMNEIQLAVYKWTVYGSKLLKLDHKECINWG